MNFLKVILVGGLILYGVYWVSTSGVAWWQKRNVKKAIQKFRSNEGYYPMRLKQLTNSKYTNIDGEETIYLTEIPIPRSGYCWSYNSNKGEIRLARRSKDAPTGSRVCP